MELTEMLADYIRLESKYDFKQFLQDNQKNERTVDDDELVLRLMDEQQQKDSGIFSNALSKIGGFFFS